MERMPYRQELDLATIQPQVGEVIASDWHDHLPVLTGERVVLRELRTSDAASLLAMLNTEEVSRFISPPPTTVEGFERFIAWTLRQRSSGTYVCFAVTLKGFDTAIGIFQVRALGTGFETAEWGFAIGSPFWGTGVFQEGAALVLGFAFGELGAHRLEARVSVKNGRGNGALLKLGAAEEAVMRKSFVRHGVPHDQVLYAILDEDWQSMRSFAQLPVSAQVH